MSTYYVPSTTPDEYASHEAPALEHIDACCPTCKRRLQRFLRPSGGGLIGVEPFYKGRDVAIPFYLSDTGQPYWHLKCPDHKPAFERQVFHIQLDAVFVMAAAGQLPGRRFILPPYAG